MVLLPNPLKAFTDSIPEIKTMLRIVAYAYFGWCPTHEEIATIDCEKARCDWEAFPAIWRKVAGGDRLPGVIEFDSKIKRTADNRIAKIRSEYVTAGKHYPRAEVKEVLVYWKRLDILGPEYT